MQTQPVKFNAWIQGGLNLYKENFVVLFTASLIAFLLSVVTCGILAGPLAVGVALITLRLIDKQEPKPEIGDVFKGFDLFLPSFLFVLGVAVAGWVGGLILGLVPFMGPLLGVLYGFALSTAVMFGIFFISEKKFDAWTAAVRSFETVKANFWPFLGLYLLTGLLSGIGAVLCGVGVVLTAPIMACVIGIAYRDIFGPGAMQAPDTEETSLSPADEHVPGTPPPASHETLSEKPLPPPPAV